MPIFYDTILPKCSFGYGVLKKFAVAQFMASASLKAFVVYQINSKACDL